MISDFKEKIKEIMEDMDCPKNFPCYRADFENLCEFKDWVWKILLSAASVMILPQPVHLDFDFGGSYLCNCPLRVFVAKKPKK